jgi:cbb3-type cytochrome oxidase subunit 3
MRKAIWLWIKRGILALMALLVLLCITLCLFWIYEKHRLAQFNRTHEGPLSEDAFSRRYTQPKELFARLKPLQGSDNLRFIAMPSFGKRWFAVSVGVINGQGVGEAVVTSPTGEVIRHEKFTLPQSDMSLFLRQWDEMVDGYSGEGRSFTDGTHLEFERRGGTRITSGSGNSPCHYDVLGDWAAQAFERYVPEMQDLRDPQLAMLLKTRTCNPSIFDLR